MARTVTPMIHVPDIRATIEWYKSIDFTVIGTDEEYGELHWAMLSFGDSQVMFNAGGRTSTDDRREVDLYVETEDVDDLYQRLKERVTIREGLHDTFYGMREFIVRDVNGFWVTFGQPIENRQTVACEGSQVEQGTHS
jgi:uncharacterized glyoxalase superfamily protein PhnB